MRVPALVAFGFVLCASATLKAQGPDVYRVLGDAPARQAEATRFLADRGGSFEPVGSASVEPGLTPADLAPLVASERALGDARTLAAQFREAEALARLTEAEAALIDQGLWLPLCHALLAELELQIAVLASALGERGLSDTALGKALTLDPARRLLAAEAPPELVARARELERQRDGAARAALHIESDRAEVELDGVQLGASPVDVQVAPGVHLLVLRAPGMQPYARVLRVASGGAWTVQLSPRPGTEALSSLATGTDPNVIRGAAARFSALTGRAVWLFAPDPQAHGTHVEHCTNGACRRDRDLAWPRDLPAPSAEARPAWKRWPLWLAVAGGVLVASGAAVWAAHDTRTREERVLTLDPGNPSPAP